MERIIEVFPEGWRQFMEVLLAPIAWIPEAQQMFLAFFLQSSTGWHMMLKVFLLLPPVFLLIAALWSTQLALYTIPFRSRRVSFVSLLIVSWWDGVRSVWMYWTGLVRLGAVALGWALALGRFAVKFLAETLRQVVLAPARMTGRMTQSYFQPGVPWIALFLLIAWGLLEA